MIAKFHPGMCAAMACVALSLVFMLPLLGAACETSCIHPAGHSCCAVTGMTGQPQITITGAKNCSHSTSMLSSSLIVPEAISGSGAVSAPLALTFVAKTPALLSTPTTASPPQFHLRI